MAASPRTLSVVQAQPAEGLGSMEGLVVHGLPVDVLAIRGRALAAVQVDARLHPVLRGLDVDRLEGDAHLAVPDVLVAIDARLDLVTGVPAHVVGRRILAA